MARTLTNAGLVLSAYGVLVIHPSTLIAEAELLELLPHLATMACDQRLHVASPHCADLFMIEACTACPSTALA